MGMATHRRLSLVTTITVTILTQLRVVKGDTFNMIYVSLFREDNEQSRSAIDMAVEAFWSAEGGIPGHNITHDVIQTEAVCLSEEQVLDALLTHLENDNVDVVIGVVCSGIGQPVVWTLKHWDVALFSNGCTDSKFTNKKRFQNLVRLNANLDSLAPACVRVMKHFNWDRAALVNIYNNRQESCEYGAVAIQEGFARENLILTEWIRYSSKAELTDDVISQYLESIAERARIIWVCINEDHMVRFMEKAHEKGMTNGDYVFLYYGPYSDSTNFHRTPWLFGVEEAIMSEAEIAERRKIFYPFKKLSFTGLVGDHIDVFRYNVSHRMLTDYGNDYSWTRTQQRGFSWSAVLYDAVYLYLIVLKEILMNGDDPRNGTLLFETAKFKQFYGISGRISMNDKADRAPDFLLYYNSPDTQEMIPWLSVTSGNDVLHNESVDILRNQTFWATPGNSVPPSVPLCGFRNENCLPTDTKDNSLVVVVSTVMAALLVTAAVVLILIWYQRRLTLEQTIQQMLWKINYSDIQISTKGAMSMVGSMMSMMTGHDASTPASLDTGIYKGTTVALKKVRKKSVTFERADLLELNMMRELAHENINNFIGACTESPNIYIVTLYCRKGSLQDLLSNDDIKLDWMFKCSLILDIANGMQFLHKSALVSHGNLRSSTCLVDSRWQIKVASFGLRAFRQDEEEPEDLTEYQSHWKLLWTAPELLRMSDADRPLYGTQKGDVYSFAILLQEIVYRAQPFFIEHQPPKEIIELIRGINSKEPHRPQLPQTESDHDTDVPDLIVNCWDEIPTKRPDFSAIRKRIKSYNKDGNFNIMDSMLAKLEKYSSNLEELVQHRTKQLVEEKKKTDMLLYRMLPRSVAEVLKTGQNVQPEMFDEVTIYFSDIVGFTSLSSESTPIQVIDLLNDLYTLCDDIIGQFDVYKVETIGDAYMVASGLPERNGPRHVAEIATMALSLLSAVHTQFRVRHRPEMKLRLRIGLHTGPCAAGVVGLTMPRYCLFGDTVNMASRMESNGEPLKIHMSTDSFDALDKMGNFQMALRGEMPIKGKGIQKTYWLLGNDEFKKSLPNMVDSDK